MINVGLIDDQQLVREGIAGLLSLSGKVTILWQATNGADALPKIQQIPVDVVLTDIRMPVMDGIELTRTLRKSGITTPVLMLTTFDDSELFIQSLKAGANGFLLKDVSLEKLISSLETINAGGFLAEPIMLKEAQVNAPIKSFKITLTEKEKTILRLLAGGFSNKEISNAVFLAEGTVRNYISIIFEKLECRDRTQAVLKAINAGLV